MAGLKSTAMKTPIELFKVFMAENASSLVSDVLNSGFIGQGTTVDDFEKILQSHLQSPYINTVNSATSGLHMAVHMIKSVMNMSPDYEVLTTPLTCTATNFAILANNVKLRWLDVDPKTCNVDVDDLARKITAKTKAVMVVHWGGYPCYLDEINKVLDKAEDVFGFRPLIIEDCAHAWGSKYKNIPIGNHGNTAVFSFQAIKHMTTGDGGVVVSPNDEFYRRAKLLRWYGLDRTSSADFRCEQNIHEWGYKFHMNNINAAIGIANIAHSNRIVQRHKDNAAYYATELANVPGISLLESKVECESSFWIYTLHAENKVGFIKYMKESGIHVSQVHDRNDKHVCLKDFQSFLPGMDKTSKTMICIPCGWWVSDENRQYIVDTIKKGW